MTGDESTTANRGVKEGSVLTFDTRISYEHGARSKRDRASFPRSLGDLKNVDGVASKLDWFNQSSYDGLSPRF